MCLILLILRKTNSYVKIVATFLAKNVSTMRTCSYLKKLFAAKNLLGIFLQKRTSHFMEVEG